MSASRPARPSISVCVVTHPGRTQAFAALMREMPTTFAAYEGRCELVVGNNGGERATATVREAMTSAGLPEAYACRIVDSPRNNIAIGRNLAIDGASHEFVAFIDDDEIPGDGWLQALVDTVSRHDCETAAGPIESRFPPGTAHWIRTMDLHNARGRKDGDEMPFAPSGNFLMRRTLAAATRFDESLGRGGGSDTDFFLRVRETGASIRWSAAASVTEQVPATQATTRYTLWRCMHQGANYRKILRERGLIRSEALFSARAIGTFALALCVAAPLLAVRHDRAGDWVKRAFSNLGKVYRPGRLLYG